MFSYLLADTLGDLINTHAIQPGARVIQAVMILLAMFSAMGAVGSHQQEHWTHALIRPVGLGVSGIGLVEVFRVAASSVISGTLGF
jgi:hypothetical protein